MDVGIDTDGGNSKAEPEDQVGRFPPDAGQSQATVRGILDKGFDVIPIAPPASIAGARASGDFFGRFENAADAVHYNILSGAERRLIAEWLDVGAQYYNNPFDVPQ